MRVGIIGSGVVAQTIGGKLVERGEDVALGTRSPQNLDDKRGMGATLGEWVARTGNKTRILTFADAAIHGEIVINATAGTVSLDALRAAGEPNLDGKILIDISNPLDFSKGMPPTLTVCNDDSVGEQIQKAFPRANVVKTLNTTNTNVMIDPQSVAGGDHHMFVCGNDAASKARVTQLLDSWFGWKHVIDLGDITNSRGMEMLLPIWIRLMVTLRTPMFNFKIAQ